MRPQIFCIKHHGEDMNGSGASLVVATHEGYAREMLFQHFINKQDDGKRMQVGARSLMQVEPFMDSFLSSYPVSLEELGVRIEYQYGGTNDDEVLRVVYIAGGAEALASELDSLQARENGGRGLSCVRSIVASLRRNDLTAAKAIVNNEGDKIVSYEAIEEVLKRAGFVYQSDL